MGVGQALEQQLPDLPTLLAGQAPQRGGPGRGGLRSEQPPDGAEVRAPTGLGRRRTGPEEDEQHEQDEQRDASGHDLAPRTPPITARTAPGGTEP